MAAGASLNQAMDLDAFLEFAKGATETYEYIDGQLYFMAGGTHDHARIALNLGPLLDRHVRDTPCTLYNSDVWVQVAEKRYLLADLVVTCDSEDRGSKTRVDSPRVVVEVLSESAESRDRGLKFELYRACPSVEEYVLINHRSQFIEVFHREGRFWTYRTYEPGENCEIRAIGFRSPVSAVYERTTIPAAPAPATPAEPGKQED
jgi:Uma2 family endonuclease